MDRIPIRILIHDPANGPPDLSGFVDPVCIPATIYVRWRDPAAPTRPGQRQAVEVTRRETSSAGLTEDPSGASPVSAEVAPWEGGPARFVQPRRTHLQLAATFEAPIERTGDPTVDDTSQRLLDILAESAEAQGEGQGRFFGTRVHVDFARRVRSANLPGIGAAGVEQSFHRGQIAGYGDEDSVRTDVVLRNDDGNVIAVYDLKTGMAQLTPSRLAEIRAELGIDRTVPIVELRYKTISTRLR